MLNLVVSHNMKIRPYCLKKKMMNFRRRTWRNWVGANVEASCLRIGPRRVRRHLARFQGRGTFGSPTHCKAYELHQQLDWQRLHNGKWLHCDLEGLPAAVQLEFRSTPKNRNHAWYCNTSQLYTAEEISDLKEKSSTTTFLTPNNF